MTTPNLVSHDKKQIRKNMWLMEGLIWSVIMFLIMEVATPYAEDQPYELKKLLTMGLVWLGVGLIYGLLMKLVRKKWG